MSGEVIIGRLGDMVNGAQVRPHGPRRGPGFTTAAACLMMASMGAIEIIRRRLKGDMVPDVPDEIGEKKKRPREVAFMDINLCFPCGKCPEFCPVQCIEYLRPGSVPGRGVQPVQDRYQECIGCYICVEVCALLTDYDAVRMYEVDLVEDLLGD
jgi:Pyruvate/2-oxoacid:ferredoxin oxidoreductase delta subunit